MTPNNDRVEGNTNNNGETTLRVKPQRNATQEAVDFLKLTKRAIHPKQLVQQLALPVSDGTLGRKLRAKALVVEEAERNSGHNVQGIHRRTHQVEEKGVLKRGVKRFTVYLWCEGDGLEVPA